MSGVREAKDSSAPYKFGRAVYRAARDMRNALRWRRDRALSRRWADLGGLRDAPSRDAVVFSSFVPDAHALEIARVFLRLFERDFADCDLYVGINAGSMSEWREDLKASPLRIRYAEVPPELAVNSDAAGFQAALQLMRDTGESYRLVWFGHTKGAVNDNPYLRSHLIDGFYRRRAHIAALFAHPRVGSYGHYMSASEGFREYADACLARVVDLPYSGIGVHYLHTFYVLRGRVLECFLRDVSDDFFQRNLVSDFGFDRYFFEGVFSSLADKYGYYPLYRQRQAMERSPWPVTRSLVRRLYAEWESQLPESDRTKVPLR